VGQWSFGVEKAVYRHKFSWIRALGGHHGGSAGRRRLSGAQGINSQLGFNIMRQFNIAAD
jgi:hypothetical protein